MNPKSSYKRILMAPPCRLINFPVLLGAVSERQEKKINKEWILKLKDEDKL